MHPDVNMRAITRVGGNFHPEWLTLPDWLIGITTRAIYVAINSLSCGPIGLQHSKIICWIAGCRLIEVNDSPIKWCRNRSSYRSGVVNPEMLPSAGARIRGICAIIVKSLREY